MTTWRNYLLRRSAGRVKVRQNNAEGCPVHVRFSLKYLIHQNKLSGKTVITCIKKCPGDYPKWFSQSTKIVFAYNETVIIHLKIVDYFEILHQKYIEIFEKDFSRVRCKNLDFSPQKH